MSTSAFFCFWTPGRKFLLPELWFKKKFSQHYCYVIFDVFRHNLVSGICQTFSDFTRGNERRKIYSRTRIVPAGSDEKQDVRHVPPPPLKLCPRTRVLQFVFTSNYVISRSPLLRAIFLNLEKNPPNKYEPVGTFGSSRSALEISQIQQCLIFLSAY